MRRIDSEIREIASRTYFSPQQIITALRIIVDLTVEARPSSYEINELLDASITTAMAHATDLDNEARAFAGRFVAISGAGGIGMPNTRDRACI